MNGRYRHLSRKYLSIMLCFIMIFVFTLTIAYAALSITLNITGTAKVNSVNWDIHLENAVVNSNSSVTNVPVVNGSTASFSVELNKPGDFYEFTVDVVNAGGIDAVISSITKSGLTTEQERYLNYTITYQNGESVTNNQLISANTSQRLLVKVEYRSDLVASDLPSTTQTFNLSFVVNYVQSSGSGISVPGNGKLISFSIDGTSYQAEEGMTWEEWVNSDYNTSGFKTSALTIINSSETMMIHYQGTEIKPNDTIMDYRYELQPCIIIPTISTFTINGTSYEFEEGMTWAEWVDSDYNTNHTWGIDNSGYVQSMSNMIFSGEWVIENWDDANSKVSSEDIIIPEHAYGLTYQGGIAN